jgi:beta-glucosidase
VRKQELNSSDAFIAAWLPGSEGAGISDLLFKTEDGTIAYDFTGKLSFSWPRYPCPSMNLIAVENNGPLFPLAMVSHMQKCCHSRQYS